MEFFRETDEDVNLGEDSEVEFDSNEFVNSIMDSYEHQYELPFRVVKVGKNYVNYLDPKKELTDTPDEGDIENVNLGDLYDLDVMFITAIIMANKHYDYPEVKLGVTVSDEDVLEITSITLYDKGLETLTLGNPDEADYEIKDRVRYYFNVFRNLGLFTYKMSDYEAVEKRTNVVTISNEAEIAVHESEGNSVTNLSRNMARRKIRMKRIKYKKAERRRKPGYRARSQKAKMRWKKYRSKYMRGIRKFTRSSYGKKLRANQGIARAKNY